MLSSYVQFLQIYSDNKLTLWLIIVFLFEAQTDSSDSIEEWYHLFHPYCLPRPT